MTIDNAIYDPNGNGVIINGGPDGTLIGDTLIGVEVTITTNGADSVRIPLADSPRPDDITGPFYSYISTLGGSDSILGTEQDNVVFSGSGNDTVYLSAGYDSIFGEDGKISSFCEKTLAFSVRETQRRLRVT